jgi:hypothetical protein
MSIKRRIAQLELVIQPAAPSWQEMMAARDRMGARACTKLRTGIEAYCGLTSEQIDEETGPPYMWRPENIERDERLLADDTWEQEEKDLDVLDKYKRAHGIADGAISDTELEAFDRQIMRLIEQLSRSQAIPGATVSVVSYVLGRDGAV